MAPKTWTGSDKKTPRKSSSSAKTDTPKTESAGKSETDQQS